MVSKVISFIPYLIVPSIFFISAYLGLTLLFTSKEALIDRYQDFFYQFADRLPDNRGRHSFRHVVVTGRLTGLVALGVCAATGFYVATSML